VIRGEHGVTLIEVAVIMVVTFALVGALAPSLSAVIAQAENTAATSAMTKIRAQIIQMLFDLNFSKFTIDGTKNATAVRLLVSDGDTPRELSGAGSALWQAPVDDGTGLTDFLERHLVLNEPGGNPLNAYTTTANQYWKGAYLTAPIDPDPWGNRYMVNSQYLNGNSNDQDVVVYSAGRNEIIETAFAVNGLTAGGDDLMLLVE
jgi:type II secretory pathway pseudopilin PulG